jgi:hypothetical protein
LELHGLQLELELGGVWLQLHWLRLYLGELWELRLELGGLQGLQLELGGLVLVLVEWSRRLRQGSER